MGDVNKLIFGENICPWLKELFMLDRKKDHMWELQVFWNKIRPEQSDILPLRQRCRITFQNRDLYFFLFFFTIWKLMIKMHLGTQQKLIFSSVERPNQDFELRFWFLIWSVISKITIRIQRHKKEQSKFRIYNTAKTVLRRLGFLVFKMRDMFT